MTDIEKAIKHFENIRDDAIVVLDSFGHQPNENPTLYQRRKLNAELAISALEKQIPKMVKYLNRHGDGPDLYNKDYFNCPSCGRRLRNKQKDKHCGGCGQALDWGEHK